MFQKEISDQVMVQNRLRKGCKQAEKDDQRCQSFALVSFQHLHKSDSVIPMP